MRRRMMMEMWSPIKSRICEIRNELDRRIHRCGVDENPAELASLKIRAYENPLHRRISIPQHQLLSCNWHGMRKKPVYIIANKCPAVRRNILRRGVHRCTAIENTDYWCWLWWARNWIQIRYFIIGEQIFVDWLEIWWRRYFRMKVFSTYLT